MGTDGLKKRVKTLFTDECSRCNKQSLCLSASSISSDLRKHYLRIHGFKIPQTQSMKDGITRHEEHQKDMQTLEEMGLETFKTKLRAGEWIRLKEAKICNPSLGLRGIVDVLEIKYTPEENKFFVRIIELKSGFYKGYFVQLNAYGLMVSNTNLKLLYDIPKKVVKEGDKPFRRIIVNLFPNEAASIDVDTELLILSTGKAIHAEFMRNNIVTQDKKGPAMHVYSKAKRLRTLHAPALYTLADIPPCSDCNPKWCGYWDNHCSKVSSVEVLKKRQRYFGKKTDLIKTKPKVIG